MNILKEKAFEYKNTPCIGRSHGILAEPMVFGLKFLNWYNQLERAYKYFKMSKEDVEQGQISGPVGTYSNISPKIEKRVCELLQLKPCKVSTQVISRDVYAYHLNSLTMIAKVIEQAAIEIRHLQKTEILEVEEGFKKGQKGSSAMPHKKNPISSENLCGLARLIKNNFNASLDNIVLWHERDISHSSVERIIFPDTTILINYMLNRFINTIENLNVNKEHMLKNINLYGGIVFSQKVMLKLTNKGLSREVVERSKLEIKKAFELADILGVKRIIFHPGAGYGKTEEDRKLGLDRLINALNSIEDELDTKNIKLYPEIGGKINQLGNLDEIIEICKKVKYTRPCLDLAHLHARELGSLNSKEKIVEVLKKIESELGREILEETHFHVYPVDFTDKGEKVHKAFGDKKEDSQLSLFVNDDEYMPKAEDYIGAIKELDLTPVTVCEAHNSQDVGAKLMKDIYFK